MDKIIKIAQQTADSNTLHSIRADDHQALDLILISAVAWHTSRARKEKGCWDGAGLVTTTSGYSTLCLWLLLLLEW